MVIVTLSLLINTVTEAIQKGTPIISVATKKKELVGNYKKPGREWERKGQPQEVNAYDFPSEALGKAIPSRVYDSGENEALVTRGTSADTAIFAVESIRMWWHRIGMERYSTSDEIVITADCGSSNRARLWKWSCNSSPMRCKRGYASVIFLLELSNVSSPTVSNSR